jgi:hypothetical protein
MSPIPPIQKPLGATKIPPRNKFRSLQQPPQPTKNDPSKIME